MTHPLLRPSVPPLSFERWIMGMAASSALATISLLVLVSSRAAASDDLIWIAVGVGTFYAIAMLGYGLRLRHKRRLMRRSLEDMRYGFNGTVTYTDAASVRGRRFESAPVSAVAKVVLAFGLAILGFIFVVFDFWH